MLSESVRMPVAFASLPSVRFCFIKQIDTLKHFKDEYLTLHITAYPGVSRKQTTLRVLIVNDVTRDWTQQSATEISHYAESSLNIYDEEGG